jgi:hypothetical protein
MITRTTLAVLGTALGLASNAAVAGDGALEINQDCAAVGCFAGDSPGFPVTISQPGHYRLSSNLATPTSGSINGILIDTTATAATAYVDLDLNGFEIVGGGTCSGNPVTTCAAGSSGRGIEVDAFGQMVRVHNGAVRGFNIGVLLISAGSGSSIEDLVTSENASAGINPQTASSATMLLDHVRSVRNGAAGASSGITGRILVRDSVFSGNKLQGLSLNAGTTIEDSTFTDNGGVGVQCSTCALGRNSFFNNNGGSSAAQFAVTTLRDMGGNVCDDGTCP